MSLACKVVQVLLLAVAALGAPPPSPCPCPKILLWVCGKDGKSYQNDCLARCAGTDVAYEGQCVSGGKRQLPKCNKTVACLVAPCSTSNSPCKGRTDLVCQNSYCSEDTKLDGYKITKGCSAVFFTKESGLIVPGCLPEPDCFCPSVFAPVCGVDKKTYGNACEANCLQVKVASTGECKVPCKCANKADWVCGRDGKSYRNPCLAKCANVTVAYKGKCQPPKSTNIQCLPSDPGVRCTKNPCDLPNTCKSNKNAVCLTLYCKTPFTFQGVTFDTTCRAVYVSKQTGVIIEGCK